MSSALKIYTRQSVKHLYYAREGEEKMGDNAHFFTTGKSLASQLAELDCKYVAFGIPEDVGVQANHGRPGAKNAWQATLKALLNVQCNHFVKGENLAILGHLDFDEEIAAAGIGYNTNPEDMHELISKIDRAVTEIVYKIVAAGKVPIAIGGGHNNAYGMLSGCAQAKRKGINTINIDAHTDMRPATHRHSGNGFRYAFEENSLQKYFMFGLHENYLMQSNIDFFEANKNRIKYNTFEDLRIRRNKKMWHEANRALDFVNDETFGIEIDCDAVEMMPSSALTPCGFQPDFVRRLVYQFSRHKNAGYLHICEAAPHAENGNEMMAVGKWIAMLMTDFMRQ